MSKTLRTSIRNWGARLQRGCPLRKLPPVTRIYMHTNPPSSDKEGRTALRRMMEVNVGVIVPAEVRMKDLLDNAVAIMSFEEAL